MMQKLFIHKLLERTKQGKRCALMGTSSRLGTTWNSIIKVYSASKSVTYYLGCALSQELKALPSPLEDGSRPDLIDYQAFVAMGIGSNLLTSHWYLKNGQISPWWVARTGLRDLGKRTITWGTFNHQIEGAIAVGFAPGNLPWLYNWMSVFLMNFISQ